MADHQFTEIDPVTFAEYLLTAKLKNLNREFKSHRLEYLVNFFLFT